MNILKLYIESTKIKKLNILIHVKAFEMYIILYFQIHNEFNIQKLKIEFFNHLVLRFLINIKIISELNKNIFKI